MAAPALRPLASLITLASQPISPSFYPYPLASTLHAARIHAAYRGRSEAMGFGRRGGKAKSWGVEIAGYLIMCWGGAFITSFLQAAPPPQLLSIHPWINYLSVHLLMTFFVPALPAPATLDTLLPIIDALARSFPITGAVLGATSHPSPAIRGSLLFQLILGALASSGGGLAASTLNVFSPSWSFSTPPVLSAGLWGSMDVWAGALGAAVFGLLTQSHPAYGPVIAALNGGKEGAIMTPLGARSVVLLVLTGLFGARAIMTHHVGTAQASKAKQQVRQAGGNATAGIELQPVKGKNVQ